MNTPLLTDIPRGVWAHDVLEKVLEVSEPALPR